MLDHIGEAALSDGVLYVDALRITDNFIGDTIVQWLRRDASVVMTSVILGWLDATADSLSRIVSAIVVIAKSLPGCQ